MAINITLVQFNRIASGDYNAGQIDFKTKEDGTVELVKINNHVWKTGKNNVVLSPERILEVKEAFLNALQKAGVSKAKLAEVRDRLGLPTELDLATSKEQRTGILKTRFSPLTRAQARELIDTYANYGKGCTQESLRELSLEAYEAGYNTRNMSASHIRTRDNTNLVSMALYNSKGSAGVNYGLTDAISLLSTSRPLAVDSRNGHLHVQKYNWLDRLDVEKAVTGLTRFADTVAAWRKLLTERRAIPEPAMNSILV